MRKYKVMFVCHGNICRSPMAEYVFKDIVKKNNKEDMFIVSSSATSLEEIGNDVYYLAKEELRRNGIAFSKRQAVRITYHDMIEYDFILIMDDYNMSNLKRMFSELYPFKNVYKLSKFISSDKDIDDPWYSRNFEKCFNEIKM